MGPAFAELHLTFDVANGRQVFVEFLAVAGVELAIEGFRVAVNGVENGALEVETVGGAGEVVSPLGDEEFAEKFLGTGDGWDAGAAARPTHLTTAVETVLGADGQGGETGGPADGFGGALIDADIALGH